MCFGVESHCVVCTCLPIATIKGTFIVSDSLYVAVAAICIYGY